METRGTFNVGAEAALWDNRLVLTAEYYHAVTRDMLYEYEVPVPPFVYDKLLANNGSLVNDGWELGLGASLVRTRDWELDLNANLTVQRSRLRSLGGDYLGMQLTAPPHHPARRIGDLVLVSMGATTMWSTKLWDSRWVFFIYPKIPVCNSRPTAVVAMA